MALSKQAIDNICGLYQKAEDKARQITVLAKLNAAGEEEIRGALKARGYALPGEPAKPPERAPGRRNYDPRRCAKASWRTWPPA